MLTLLYALLFAIGITIVIINIAGILTFQRFESLKKLNKKLMDGLSVFCVLGADNDTIIIGETSIHKLTPFHPFTLFKYYVKDGGLIWRFSRESKGIDFLFKELKKDKVKHGR